MCTSENLFPKYIVANPGEEVWEKNRAWQGCPTIVRTKGGRLFAGWYTGGMFEPCIDNYNVLIQSDDGGNSWSKPILAVYSDSENMHRNIDIQLWVDNKNRLWVMWTHSPFYSDSVPATIKTPFVWGKYHTEFTGVEALICNDPDADVLVWEKPRVICGGFLRCKPIIRYNGDYIFPAYDWINKANYILRISKDEGQSFTDVLLSPKPQNNVYDETMAYEVGKRLCIMARTNLGYYLHSYSDDGTTWTDPIPYQSAPSTRFYIGRVSSGELVYVRNISNTERQGIKICLSTDDGVTWPYELVLDTRENVSYPDLTEGENGTLYIVHDCERDNRYHLNEETWTSEAAKEILLSKITLQDIYNGTLSKDSYIAKVISKAEINVVEK